MPKDSSMSGKTLKNGLVMNALPNTMFRVQTDNGTNVLTHLSGKMRLHRIKVLVGDKVKIELDEYDGNKGKIIQRL